MAIFPICTTCGVQYEAPTKPHGFCMIYENERQYVNPTGQSWTIPEEMALNYINQIEQVEPNLFPIHTSPSFGIGQRAHLLITPHI